MILKKSLLISVNIKSSYEHLIIKLLKFREVSNRAVSKYQYMTNNQTIVSEASRS